MDQALPTAPHPFLPQRQLDQRLLRCPATNTTPPKGVIRSQIQPTIPAVAISVSIVAGSQQGASEPPHDEPAPAVKGGEQQDAEVPASLAVADGQHDPVVRTTDDPSVPPVASEPLQQLTTVDAGGQQDGAVAAADSRPDAGTMLGVIPVADATVTVEESELMAQPEAQQS